VGLRVMEIKGKLGIGAHANQCDESEDPNSIGHGPPSEPTRADALGALG